VKEFNGVPVDHVKVGKQSSKDAWLADAVVTWVIILVKDTLGKLAGGLICLLLRAEGCTCQVSSLVSAPSRAHVWHALVAALPAILPRGGAKVLRDLGKRGLVLFNRQEVQLHLVLGVTIAVVQTKSL